MYNERHVIGTMVLAAGARLGPYEIHSPLGSGGMGDVYRATDTRLDRTVAIKVLAAALASDRQFRDRFDREARAVSALDHPHICTLDDVGEHDGTSYLVMQYLEGEMLEARLKPGALPLDFGLAKAGRSSLPRRETDSLISINARRMPVVRMNCCSK